MKIKKAYQLTMFNDVEEVYEYSGEKNDYGLQPRKVKPDKTGKDESAFRRHAEACIIGYEIPRISVKKFLNILGKDSDDYHFRFYPTREQLILVFPKWNQWTLLERVDKHYAMIKYLTLEDVITEWGDASTGYISSRTKQGKRIIAKIFLEYYNNENKPT